MPADPTTMLATANLEGIDILIGSNRDEGELISGEKINCRELLVQKFNTKRSPDFLTTTSRAPIIRFSPFFLFSLIIIITKIAFNHEKPKESS